VAGSIRGLEPRLRLVDADFLERRLIRRKALSTAFIGMFAASEAKSFRTMEQIPAQTYMRSADVGMFVNILVPLHSGFDRLRLGEPRDYWSNPKYDLLELSLLKSRPEHRFSYQRSLPGLAASGANRSKPLCKGTRCTRTVGCWSKPRRFHKALCQRRFSFRSRKSGFS